MGWIFGNHDEFVYDDLLNKGFLHKPQGPKQKPLRVTVDRTANFQTFMRRVEQKPVESYVTNVTRFCLDDPVEPRLLLRPT
jgi:hypothetical protein